LEINQAGPPVSLAGFDLHAINSRAMRMARARHSLATGHVVEALVNLKGIYAEALANGAGERLLEGLVLLALAYRADGQWDLASASLEDALRRAAQENYLRVFLDEGKPVHSLLADYLAKTRPNRTGRRTETVERRYARQLVAAIDQHQANRAAHISSDLSLPTTTIAPNHEPLSPREIEVVERLVMGESAKEIAQGLCISINTVKVHIKSIYRKLGSHSRKVVFNRLRAADRSERVEERAPIP
jgi:LuxR family maltose regulon positive regulatory protein